MGESKRDVMELLKNTKNLAKKLAMKGLNKISSLGTRAGKNQLNQDEQGDLEGYKTYFSENEKRYKKLGTIFKELDKMLEQLHSAGNNQDQINEILIKNKLYFKNITVGMSFNEESSCAPQQVKEVCDKFEKKIKRAVSLCRSLVGACEGMIRLCRNLEKSNTRNDKAIEEIANSKKVMEDVNKKEFTFDILESANCYMAAYYALVTLYIGSDNLNRGINKKFLKI